MTIPNFNLLGKCEPYGEKNPYWILPNTKVKKCEDFKPDFEDCIAVNFGEKDCNENCPVPERYSTIQGFLYVGKDEVSPYFTFEELPADKFGCVRTKVTLHVQYTVVVERKTPSGEFCSKSVTTFEECYTEVLCGQLDPCDKARFIFIPKFPYGVPIYLTVKDYIYCDYSKIGFTAKIDTGYATLGKIEGIDFCDITIPAVRVDTPCLSDDCKPPIWE